MNAPDPIKALNIAENEPLGLHSTAAIPPLKNMAGVFILPSTYEFKNCYPY